MAFFRGEEGSVAFSASGSKKVSCAGVVTGTSLSATTGDIETVSVSFTTNGTITSAV